MVTKIMPCKVMFIHVKVRALQIPCAQISCMEYGLNNHNIPSPSSKALKSPTASGTSLA